MNTIRYFLVISVIFVACGTKKLFQKNSKAEFQPKEFFKQASYKDFKFIGAGSSKDIGSVESLADKGLTSSMLESFTQTPILKNEGLADLLFFFKEDLVLTLDTNQENATYRVDKDGRLLIKQSSSIVIRKDTVFGKIVNPGPHVKEVDGEYRLMYNKDSEEEASIGVSYNEQGYLRIKPDTSRVATLQEKNNLGGNAADTVFLTRCRDLNYVLPKNFKDYMIFINVIDSSRVEYLPGVEVKN